MSVCILETAVLCFGVDVLQMRREVEGMEAELVTFGKDTTKTAFDIARLRFDVKVIYLPCCPCVLPALLL